MCGHTAGHPPEARAMPHSSLRVLLCAFAFSCGHADGDACYEARFFADADGDGHGDAARPATACAVPAGYTTTSDDCDDDDPAVHPAADELCNALDDDCDETIDEDPIDGTSFY